MRVRVLVPHVVSAGVVARKGTIIDLEDRIARQRMHFGYVEPAPEEVPPAPPTAAGSVEAESTAVPATAEGESQHASSPEGESGAGAPPGPAALELPAEPASPTGEAEPVTAVDPTQSTQTSRRNRR